MFRDRFNILLIKVYPQYPKSAILPLSYGDSIHERLDAIDRKVGIRTRHGCASAYTQGADRWPVQEYVGARLARLERHVEANKEPAMFWLGAEGDNG